MKWLLFVLMMIIGILLVICYSLVVIAHEADRRAEQMYQAWKEQCDEQMD